MTVLRVGIVGLGVMGRNHARVLRELSGVELVGIVDDRYRQDSHQGTPVYRQLTELLALRLDYAVVCTPTASHEQVAIVLAEAGVNALIEKPIAATVTSAERIRDTFNSKGLFAAVGHIERFNPAVRNARQRIEHGQIGQILQIATRRQGPYPARIADVGVVKDLGTHDIDATMWLAGSTYETLSAQTIHRSGRAHEDLVAIVGRLASGAIASHLVNWLSPTKERTLVITGDRGALSIDTLRADLTFFENGSVATTWDSIAQFRGVTEGDVVRYAFPKPEPLRTEHENFRDALLGLPNDCVSAQHGVEVIRVAARALESGGH